MGMSYSRSFSLDSGRVLGVRGLFNWSLSCCVNALLQSFSATTELFDLLNRWQPPDELQDTRNVPLQLKKALHAMRDPRQPDPHHDLLDCLHHNFIFQYRQHDADEVFHAILNLIEQQMSDPSLAAEIKNLYKISVEGQISCLTCTYVHRVSTFFLSLPLHLSEDRNTLEDCIRSFFEVQTLEDSESFCCDRCEEKQPTSQGFKIVSLPSILCIHLKRFKSVHGTTWKLSCEVTFPEFFNMANVLKEEPPTQETVCFTGMSNAFTALIQILNLNKNRFYVEKKTKVLKVETVFVCSQIEGNYSLYAVIVHSGFKFGHYTAYIRSMPDNTWYYTNDSEVHQASWKDVQQTYGPTKTAYILLYRRCSTEAVQGSSG